MLRKQEVYDRIAEFVAGCFDTGLPCRGRESFDRKTEKYPDGRVLCQRVRADAGSFSAGGSSVFFMGLPLHVLTVVYLILLTALTAAGLI